MTDKNRSILQYYKDGGDTDMYPSRRAAYKKKYLDWTTILDHYFNKKKLKMSGRLLIKHLKDSEDVADYKIPSARFADAWLSRSLYKQIHTGTRVAKSISVVLAYYPNQLLMSDTTFIKKKEAEEIHSKYLLPKAKQQLFEKGFRPGEATAMITMIDVLTRRGYAYPVKRPGSAEEGKKALKSMISQAQKWALSRGFGRKYDTKYAHVKRILTDQGSEFKGIDNPNMTQGYLKQRNIKQQFTFEGKSQALSIGERFNGTIKTIMRGLQGQNTDGTVRWDGWTNKLEEALQIYNDKYHSTIKTSPNKVSSNPNKKHYYKNIIERLKLRQNQGKPFTKSSYKPGDYVRLISYNESKDKRKPNWTWKRGPMLFFVNRNRAKYGSPEMWAGIHMIHKVIPGKGGRSTIYSVWSQYHTENSGAQGRQGERTINIPGNLFDGETYPARAELRRFTAEELLSLPTTTRAAGKGKGKTLYPDIINDIPKHVIPPPEKPILRSSTKKKETTPALSPNIRRSKRIRDKK